MIIGTLPVVIAISANLRDAPPRRPPAVAAAAAVAAADRRRHRAASTRSSCRRLRADPAADPCRYAHGALLAVGAVACWTWYPLRNADWLRAHPDRNPRTWATAQGVATLPLAAARLCAAVAGHGGQLAPSSPMPFGPRPWFFVGLMFAIGLFASWLGTLCWNEASQRLPTTLAGQLIVFETLAALAYAFVLRGRMPEPLTLLGIALLVAGVVWAVRIRPEPVVAEGHGT